MNCIKKIKKWDDSTGNIVRQEFPCGQCMPCRITRRQEWTLRLLLESYSNAYNYFITLTYDAKNLQSPSLQKDHLQKWLKRVRKRLKKPVKYYAVGEYGGRDGRPHWHILMFTPYPPHELGYESIKKNKKGQLVKILKPSIFGETWDKGKIDDRGAEVQILENGQQTIRSARYVAGYCLKKLTDNKSADRIAAGLAKEAIYCSRSRRDKQTGEWITHGIGLSAAKGIAHKIRRANLSVNNIGTKSGYGSFSLYMLRVDGKKYPIDRTLRERIIEYLDQDERTPTSKAITHNQKVLTRIILTDAETETQKEQSSEYQASRILQTVKESRTL